MHLYVILCFLIWIREYLKVLARQRFVVNCFHFQNPKCQLLRNDNKKQTVEYSWMSSEGFPRELYSPFRILSLCQLKVRYKNKRVSRFHVYDSGNIVISLEDLIKNGNMGVLAICSVTS